MTADTLWLAEDVMRAVQGECLHEQSWHATGVAIDSRSVKTGDLFIALQGPTHDGHDHVAAAIAAGASAAIVARKPPDVPPQAPLIVVADTLKALEDIGRAGRRRADGRIVAVTGSVGKTGTKEMLRLMLASCGDTYANEGSFNNHWGVPLSLARLPAAMRYGVFELGMNHPGELGPFSQLVRPHVALITTIEAVHLEFFASLDEIADAKAEIFTGLPPDAAAVLNRDNDQFARLAAAAKAQGLKRILSFGRHPKTEARLLDCTATQEGSMIRAEIMGRQLDYLLSVPGEHLALNSVGALLAAAASGADIEACAAALGHYHPPKGRGVIQTVELEDGAITVIDESYNASPAALRFAIRVLGQMQPEGTGRRLLALGDMRELGAQSPALHAALAADIVQNGIDQVFTCGAMMEHLHNALPAKLRGQHAADSQTIATLVALAVRPGDIVTVKGSNSMQMKLVVEALRGLSLGVARQRQLAG